MGEYYLLDLSSSQLWNENLLRLPVEQKDVYFTPEYYKLYQELGDGEAKCFVYKNFENIALYPFLINCVNYLGYELDRQYFDIQGAYGYNGIVTSTYDNNFIKNFYSAFNAYCENENIIAEFSRFHPLLKNHLFSKQYLQVIFDRKIIYLDLKNNYDSIFSNFQTTTRKQIKRASKKYNLRVTIYENDISILDTFYQIYFEAMVRVKSIPYLFFNKSYFKSLIKNTQNVCFIAYHEEKPIAAILAFYNNHYINGHLGGSLSSYLHFSPISLLYSEMIKFGQIKNCQYLNIGGGATKNPEDTLLSFKLNFSSKTSDFFIGKRILDTKIYNEVIRQWESKYPEKNNSYQNMLLKYHF
jgi:hypothetical protein